MARILVADDNALSLEFFAESISRCGHLADTARDGVEACLRASEHGYDLMIIDSRMPLRSGPEALRIIREGQGPSRKTRAIATTADAGIDHESMAKAGFSAVVIKPITMDSLADLLDSHLSAVAPAMEILSDEVAVSRFGGDRSIMVALRKLLAIELDALADEIRIYAVEKDLGALRDRLHRLDASAGFCGANRLVGAAQDLRRALDLANDWPETAIDALLVASAETRDSISPIHRAASSPRR
jgi:CheY-like chemotaxis protein